MSDAVERSVIPSLRALTDNSVRNSDRAALNKYAAYRMIVQLADNRKQMQSTYIFCVLLVE